MSDTGLWRYRAALRRVIDGDTLEVVLDLGFDLAFQRMALRLLDLNAPEITGPGKPAGLAAKAYAEQWCQAALDPRTPWPLLVETVKGDQPDKYGGRWLARVYRQIDGRCLNIDLLAADFALPWDGKGPKP
jgi:endonuclease YncB( thermonuclease family)